MGREDCKAYAAELVKTPGTLQEVREMAGQNTLQLQKLLGSVKYLKSLLEGELLGMGESKLEGKSADIISGNLASEVAQQSRLAKEINALVWEVTRRVDGRHATNVLPQIGEEGHRVGRVAPLYMPMPSQVQSITGDPYPPAPQMTNQVRGGEVRIGGGV